MKFTEAKLEHAIIELLEKQGYPHTHGEQLKRPLESVLIKTDLEHYLNKRYQTEAITKNEIKNIIHQLE